MNRTQFDPAFIQSRKNALLHLLEAQRTAEELGDPIWELALHLPALRSGGATDTALRWLIRKKWVEHRYEYEPASNHRSFSALACLRFTEESCFVLTSAGLIAAAEADRVEPRGAPHSPGPHYDASRRILFFGKDVVKRFRVPAANQELILLAFEEENWPPHLNDPLPGKPHTLAKRRLSDTIRQLNACHELRSLQFRGDGTGAGIVWDILR